MSDYTPPSAAGMCAELMTGLPIAGAAFTVMTSDAMRDTVCASDETIASLVQLQYSIGEGPALDAFKSRRSVLVPDLSTSAITLRWPFFTPQAERLAGALFTFPMQLGAITVGVCDTYRPTTGRLDPTELAAILRSVDLATISLLAIHFGDDPARLDQEWLDVYDRARTQVHQATGMVTVHLGVGITEAFGRLRAHAYSQNQSIGQVAADIIGGELRLEPDPL